MKGIVLNIAKKEGYQSVKLYNPNDTPMGKQDKKKD
ncbi:hypothetical protein AEQU1_01988 [Aequorivita sp. CIP111184]|nr:hypothetical protein AEQU1_01988 [Aequorivita sp. CIP111184]